MNWINLAQDESKWRAVVNTAMNSAFYKMWLAQELATCEEGFFHEAN
jgi:hypothetical protein